MPLKLNAFSGGSVTLNPDTTASDFTHTLPAVSGTVVTTGSSAVVTPAMLSTGAPSWNASGLLSFNSGFGSVGVAYGCRAWVNFNGTGTVAIRASGNVSSITDNGTGEYTINFTTAMPDANYSWSFGANNTANDASNSSTVAMTTTANQALSSLRIVTKTIVGGGAQSSADVSLINILILR